MPKPIRRNDGKVLRTQPYKIPSPLAKPDAQDIAETLERIILDGTVGDGYVYYEDEDDNSCIEMN